MKVKWVEEELPSEPKPRPIPSVVQVNVPAKGIPWWVLVAIVAAVLLWLNYEGPRPEPSPQPDDQVVVIDDDKQPEPQPAVTDLKDATLIFVYERMTPSASQVMVVTSVTTEGLQARGMKGFRPYDKDQSEVKALVDYAVAKNTPPPFVALVRNKEPIKLAPFPASPAELEAFLK